LASFDIKDEIKVKLRKEYAMLNPAELKRKITESQDKLLKLNAMNGPAACRRVIHFTIIGSI